MHRGYSDVSRNADMDPNVRGDPNGYPDVRGDSNRDLDVRGDSYRYPNVSGTLIGILM